MLQYDGYIATKAGYLLTMSPPRAGYVLQYDSYIATKAGYVLHFDGYITTKSRMCVTFGWLHCCKEQDMCYSMMATSLPRAGCFCYSLLTSNSRICVTV